MTDEEIDKLEEGPELDRLVAERVMGWTYDEPRWLTSDGKPTGWNGDAHRIFSPSTDIAAAWVVITQAQAFLLKAGDIPGDWVALLGSGIDDKPFWSASFGCLDPMDWRDATERDHSDCVHGDADSSPLAICRAALKAVMRA